jgi:hypothetical protein
LGHHHRQTKPENAQGVGREQPEVTLLPLLLQQLQAAVVVVVLVPLPGVQVRVRVQATRLPHQMQPHSLLPAGLVPQTAHC